MVPEQGLTPSAAPEPEDAGGSGVGRDANAAVVPPLPAAEQQGLTTPVEFAADSWTPQAAFPPPPPPPAVQPWASPAAPPPGFGPGGYGFVPPPPAPSAYVHVASPAKPTALPVEAREYHQFYRGPRFRWWKPLAAIAAFVVVWALGSVPPVVAALGWELLHNGGHIPSDVSELNTPSMFLANNVAIAVGIVAAVLVSWMVYRQRPRWLSSVEGHFRWRVFWRFLAIAIIGLGVAWAVEVAVSGGVGEFTVTPATWALVVGIVLTTPFQAAGEEYAMRGLVFRSIASWFPNRWVGLVIGIIVNAVAFMFLHGAEDVWLNFYYFFVGTVFSILVWRTGGLEAAIAMHIANNLISEMLLPFQPSAFSHLFDRQAGVAGPEILIQFGVTALVAAVLLWQSSRLKLPRATAPGAVTE